MLSHHILSPLPESGHCHSDPTQLPNNDDEDVVVQFELNNIMDFSGEDEWRYEDDRSDD